MSPYVEEVKLINLAADAVGEEEHISLEPRHGLSRILEADAGTAHDDWRMMRTRSWKTESECEVESESKSKSGNSCYFAAEVKGEGQT